MKTPLLLITIPYTIAFLAGIFGWYMEEGLLALLGIAILIGIGWAWKIELNK